MVIVLLNSFTSCLLDFHIFSSIDKKMFVLNACFVLSCSFFCFKKFFVLSACFVLSCSFFCLHLAMLCLFLLQKLCTFT